jgi:hypothetical protein
VVTTDFAKNALKAPANMAPLNLPNSQTAQEVAEKIVGLILAPTAELYTQPGQRDTAVKYLQDVEAFENTMGR